MANDPTRAIAKYYAKASPARTIAVVTPLVTGMKVNAAVVFEQIITMEQQVRQTLNASGVSVIQYPFFLCFGRQIWSKIRKGMAGESLAEEVALLLASWVARGLSQAVLQAVRTDVFNVSAPIAP